ncbi:hypothetical protein D3C76_1329080 [compost metagenome]
MWAVSIARLKKRLLQPWPKKVGRSTPKLACRRSESTWELFTLMRLAASLLEWSAMGLLTIAVPPHEIAISCVSLCCVDLAGK